MTATITNLADVRPGDRFRDALWFCECGRYWTTPDELEAHVEGGR